MREPFPAPDYGEYFYKQLIDNLYDAVYFVDCERRITYWNRAAEQLTGYAAAEVVGRSCSDNLLVHTDDCGVELCLTQCPLNRSLRDGCAHEADLYLRHKRGHRLPVSVRVSPILSPAGDTVGAVEVFSDNTLKKESENRVAQLQQMAFLDTLTGVPNRHFLELRLNQALQECRRYGHRFGLMLADLDHFKQINDAYGHSLGDAALIVTAQTLTHGLRSVDHVGRWGGDEFLAILSEVSSSGLRKLTERCRSLVEHSRVSLSPGDLGITVSIGATLISSEDQLSSALQRVDRALYESKKQGRNHVTIG
jgi:diguanylate cyclase (GGDEF)-like protein/PAS domain S-box-containing protein